MIDAEVFCTHARPNMFNVYVPITILDFQFKPRCSYQVHENEPILLEKKIQWILLFGLLVYF
jgi:hypothetical protein